MALSGWMWVKQTNPGISPRSQGLSYSPGKGEVGVPAEVRKRPLQAGGVRCARPAHARPFRPARSSSAPSARGTRCFRLRRPLPVGFRAREKAGVSFRAVLSAATCEMPARTAPARVPALASPAGSLPDHVRRR